MVIYPVKTLLVSIIDGNKAYRDNLQKIINKTDGLKCLGAFENYKTAIKQISRNIPDIVFLYIKKNGDDADIQCIRIIKDIFPKVNIIVLTECLNTDAIINSLRNGAAGCLLYNSSSERIIEAIKETCNGGAPLSTEIARKIIESFWKPNPGKLTKRQITVLKLLCIGKSNRDIAEILFIDLSTVKFHIKNIYKKLKVKNKAQAIIKANDYCLK